MKSIKIETKNNTQMFAAKKTISRLAIVAGCMVLFLSNETIAQDGEKLFKQHCAVCHKVGGGRMVGPDLIGVTARRSEEWLMKWTKGSQAFIKSGDVDAKTIFDEFNGTIMPDMAHIPDADIKAIYAFIASKDAPATASVVTSSKEVVPDASNNAAPEEIESGKLLFIGSQAFTNGGPACISCHNVSYKDVLPGGLLAKDLTNVYSRLGGDAGLIGMLGAPPFPAMTQAYKDKPITEKEIAALIAFFNKVDKDKVNQAGSTADYLLYGGSVGLIVLLILIYGIWMVRKKHTVKKDIYDRQLKSIN